MISWRLLLSLILSGTLGLSAGENPTATRTRPNPTTASPGVLEIQSIYLHAPASTFVVEDNADQSPLWKFVGGTAESVAVLLTEAEVPPALREGLLATAVAWRAGGGITLVPSPEQILALTPKSRQHLYEKLAQWPVNRYYATPLIIPAADVDDWLNHTQLSPEQRERMRQLFWWRGECHAFSDLSLMLKTAANAREMKACLRAMTQTRALMIRLRVPSRDQVKAVARYWSAGPNPTDVAGFLYSAVDSGLESVDLIHLLPPLCRRWLNTYPTLASEMAGRFPDCAWTALNFFSIAPEPYYLDANTSNLELRENYEPIDAASRFGDLVCFATETGIIHTCVFIADGIVLTKNGTGLAQPWQLVPMADVDARYHFGAVTRVLFFRKHAPDLVEQH